MDEFVELRRNFYSVSTDDAVWVDYEDKPNWAMSEATHWDELEHNYRTIILAEAGSGKTIEIQQAAKRIKSAGKYAFFIRLEYLSEGMEYAFDDGQTGTLKEFEEWLASDEEAWLFLDSVDEARLRDPRDFEKAIRKLARNLSAASQRAHIFLTSRISEWRPKADLALIVSQLPFHSERDGGRTDVDSGQLETTEENFFSKMEPNDENSKPKQNFRVVSLGPLDDNQIKRLSSALKVPNEVEFFEELERRDVGDYLSRPQDFIELVNFWKTQGYIGSRGELLEADIELRLQERDHNRDLLRPLSRNKAHSGLKRLAAAVTYQKLSRIQIPGSHVHSDCIKPSLVLDDWSTAEISSLLARPIFDQAMYGTVRFHHRSVREYLCADWFLELLEAGKSRREIESLFFRTQYEIKILVPTSRPILPWLAISDQLVRDKVKRVAPEILFHGGDPSKLPLDVRASIIKDVCNRIGSEAFFRSAVDYSAIKRFATGDLESTVKDLIIAHKDDPNVNTLLLGLIWHGKYTSCREIVFDLAINPVNDKYTRVSAFRALNAVGTSQNQKDVATTIARTRPHPSRRLLSEAIDLFAPKYLAISELIAALEFAVEPEEHGYSGIEQSLQKITDRLSESDLVEMLHGLATLLRRPPLRGAWSTGIIRRISVVASDCC